MDCMMACTMVEMKVQASVDKTGSTMEQPRVVWMAALLAAWMDEQIVERLVAKWVDETDLMTVAWMVVTMGNA